MAGRPLVVQLRARACSVATLKKASLDLTFDDPCFVKAGQDLKTFIDSKPFQTNFIATPGQNDLDQRQRSARQRQGRRWSSWVTGTRERSRTSPPTRAALAGPPFLGWFPVPAISGSAGDPKARPLVVATGSPVPRTPRPNASSS